MMDKAEVFFKSRNLYFEKTDDADEIEYQICVLYNSCAVEKYLIRNFPTFTKDEIEDIVDDVFCYVIENIKKLNDKAKLKNWTYKIARSFACMEKNKQKEKPLELYGEDFCDIVEKASLHCNNVAEEMRHKVLNEFVVQMIDVLPPVCREIMKLRYVDDLLLKEIGECLNLSYGNVRSIHARCLKMLRELLRESGIRMEDFYK